MENRLVELMKKKPKKTIQLGIVGFFIGVFIAYMFCDIAQSPYNAPPIHHIMTRGLALPKPELLKIDPVPDLPPLPPTRSRPFGGPGGIESMKRAQKKIENDLRRMENEGRIGHYLNRVSTAKAAFDEIFMGGFIGAIIGAVIGHFSGLLKNKQPDN